MIRINILTVLVSRIYSNLSCTSRTGYHSQIIYKKIIIPVDILLDQTDQKKVSCLLQKTSIDIGDQKLEVENNRYSGHLTVWKNQLSNVTTEVIQL